MNPPSPVARMGSARIATGVRLSYAELGDRSAPPVILLHGYTDSWFSFSRVLPGLAASCRTLAISQRGHGDSERPADGYTIRGFAADAMAFADAMGLKRAAIVGHSMGSLVAQQIALDFPDRVAFLVLAGSATHMHSANVDDLAQAVLALQDAVPDEFVRDFQAGTIHHGVPAEFLAGVVAESLKVPVHVWRAALEAQLAADFTGQVRRIGAPTLALWGDADTIFSAEARQALASGLPDAIVKVYPDTGHAPHWERPAEFVQDVLSFLRTGTA